MSMGFGMGGFDLMFSIFPFLFITVFVIVMLAEGDQGSLTFQGTRYLGFERS